jgi:eukaryotic-like serine/threonine-protein kinase
MKKSYTISVPVRTFWTVVVPLAVFITAVGMLFGILAVDRIIMPTIVHVNKDMIEVPSIEGQPYEEARQKLYDVGLYCDVQAKEYNDKIGREIIITQAPVSGTKVKKGRQVAVVVSKGPLAGPVPHVRKLSERQAKAELRKAGFELGKSKKVYSEDITKDLVVTAVPEEGTIISREMTVDIHVSNGPRPTHVEVPNLVGESIGSAQAKLEDAGLSAGTVSTDNNPSLAPGTVISQSVSPGTSVPLESAVDLVVAVRK